jgi:ComF family protein
MALINDFMSLIYPRSCEACEEVLFKHEQYICNACQLTLPKSNFHLSPNNPISMALAGRVPVKNATCLFEFEKLGRVQKLLHALKYENQQTLGEFMGKQLYHTLSNSAFFEGIDVIVPVPLHPNKLKQRGYNQSACFAKGISDASGIPVNTSVLHRSGETSTQTKKKKFERWENVGSVFTLTDHAFFQNKHILLVDDVITTGATIEGCWQALKEVDNISVSLASIAYALK